MREYFDDLDDIELDDNEIVNRLMREWEMEDRRKAGGVRRVPARVLAALADDDIEDDLDDDDSYDEFEDDGADQYDDDY